jgi:predicted dehydrogenase
MNRRYFLANTAAAATALRSSALASPNNTVRIACVGFNGRGVSHLRAYPRVPNTEIVALCDVDEAVLDKGVKMVEAATKKRPAAYTDLRKLLEDKSIDGISIATPNHQHTLQTIWGCQAGKDVYVEKPCSYNMFEARQIVAAARRYGRMVQHGAGGSGVMLEAREKMAGGLIGDLYMARGLVFKWRDTIGRAKPEPVPAGVHYDLWLGPAPRHDFTRNRFHYNFHWFWDYGNGDIGNQGIHQMHAARFGLSAGYPTKVTAMGGHYMFDDDQETPNTILAAFEFDEGGKKKMLEFEVRHWITNNEAGINLNRADPSSKGNGPPMTVGNIFYGSKGYLVIDGNYRKFETFMGPEQAPGPGSSSTFGDTFASFVTAIRSRKLQDLTAEIEEGAKSTVLVHLANISYRLGRTLHFDPATWSCKGDSEATRMFSRPEYRAPYIVPKLV